MGGVVVIPPSPFAADCDRGLPPLQCLVAASALRLINAPPALVATTLPASDAGAVAAAPTPSGPAAILLELRDAVLGPDAADATKNAGEPSATSASAAP